MYAVAPLQPATALRAATTASRASFRDARAMLYPSTSSVRPDSERGNAPPTKSLYVLRTGKPVAHSNLRYGSSPWRPPSRPNPDSL